MGENMNERTISLIGTENIKKIEQKHILIVGIGGVGGTALEALIRSGIRNITIIDSDNFDESNINRHILATTLNLGEKKTKIAKKRMLEINPNINIQELDIFLNKENMNRLEKYDYIIDACDTITTKIELIKYALKNNLKIISCLGTGKKLDPTKLEITTLNKTYNDPLAKVMRKLLKEENITLSIPVVFSSEQPINNDHKVSSMIFVPSTAGLLLANYVIKDIIQN